MEYFYNGNKPSMPQQVDINTKNIDVLKKITETPAVIYNASVEISTDAGTVSEDDIIQNIETEKNAFILDTVGSLFRIINVVGTTIYIMYVSSIRGPQGEQGEQGEPGETPEIDDTLSNSSENPVQNKVITNALNDKQNTLNPGTITDDGVPVINTNDTVVSTFYNATSGKWYRAWASGWKECGGKFTITSISANASEYNAISIPLVIPHMLNISISCGDGTNAKYANAIGFVNDTETIGVSVQNLNTSNAIANLDVYYTVTGY